MSSAPRNSNSTPTPKYEEDDPIIGFNRTPIPSIEPVSRSRTPSLVRLSSCPRCFSSSSFQYWAYSERRFGDDDEDWSVDWMGASPTTVAAKGVPHIQQTDRSEGLPVPHLGQADPLCKVYLGRFLADD